jgi:hypothetical protein
MTTHAWKDGPYRHKFESMSIKRRTCTLCGAEQHESVETAWGRVTGRRWLPLVGRCKGKKP